MQEQRQIDVQNQTEERRQTNSVGILIGLAVVVSDRAGNDLAGALHS